MKRISIIYGSIAGGIVILSIIVGLVLSDDNAETNSPWLGYLIMIVALSLIFVAIKRYRDRELGGVIRFGTAFLLGLGITLVASVVYVAVWEVYLATTGHRFIDDYTASVIESKREEGLTGSDLDQVVDEMEQLKAQYANPLFRLPMTLLEIFPVGLLISLLSALLLRNSNLLPARPLA